MERITRTFTCTEFGRSRSSEAYSDDGGLTWRWVSNDSVIMLDVCRSYGIPCDDEKQRAARDEEVSTILSDYRAQNQGRKRTSEEIFEQRAAFGEGVELVDVLTGDRWAT